MKSSILLYFDGNTRLQILSKLLKNIIATANSNDRSFTLYPVLLNEEENSQILSDISGIDFRIHTITDIYSLKKYLKQASLIVGTLETSLFESVNHSVPALTLSFDPNQNEDIFYLEQLGHYLHLQNLEVKDIKSIVELIWILKTQTNRIREYSKTNIFEIDKCDSQNIIDAPNGSSSIVETIKAKYQFKKKYKKSKLKSKYIKLSSEISVRKVVDTDINHYICAINMVQNRKNMANTSPASRLNHYKWWFSTDVDHYLLLQSRKPKLYIWQKLIQSIDQSFWIAGWFTCDQKISLDVFRTVMEWQHHHCFTIKPNARWLAITKKSNVFVYRLNKLMKFEDVTESQPEFKIINSIYPSVSNKEFHYLSTPKISE